MYILNVAAGKFDPLPLPGMKDDEDCKYVLNVDTSYFDKVTPEEIEENMIKWHNHYVPITVKKYLSMNIFEFMERTKILFDHVAIYRFLEHVSFTQVEYFIYLVSTILKPGGTVDVIVPNYRILGEMLINEENHYNNPDFEFHPWNILLTTELLNEPSCPHASIWTPERINYFWKLERRFNVKTVFPSFKFDGRDIYLRAIIERV